MGENTDPERESTLEELAQLVEGLAELEAKAVWLEGSRLYLPERITSACAREQIGAARRRLSELRAQLVTMPLAYVWPTDARRAHVRRKVEGEVTP